jgi:molybdenum cofactor guanylyltransferase
MNSPIGNELITAIVLSGGEARRMGGGEKGVLPFAGRPMISYVIATLESLDDTIETILINTNDPGCYEQFKQRTLSDNLTENIGPLAGVEAGLVNIESGYLLVVSSEPIVRLINAVSSTDANCAVVHDGDRMQTTFAIFHVNQRSALQAYLKRGGRRLMTWYKEQNAVEVDCSDLNNVFVNINTQKDLASAEALFLE